MNKIEIVNDVITSKNIDDTITIEFISKNELFDVNNIKITILKDTSLNIDYTSTIEHKLDIFITIKENSKLNLYEYRNGQKTKIQYKINLEKDSLINIDKFYDVNEIKEMNIISLNGENASYNLNFKTISKNKEKYDTVIYHNAKKTISNIINNGININNGELKFNISTFIPKGNISCNASQNSRIINLTNNFCEVKPNLFIDEYDVIANHAAHIGTFDKQEIFYLMSRGITKEAATNLLIRGFLLRDTKLIDKIENSIKKYWR